MAKPIKSSTLPENALLNLYAKDNHYTDCYVADIKGIVSISDYVLAFYTSAIFKLERVLLKWVISKPSTDLQAEQLAISSRKSFSAWHVENRTENQLLMCDFRGETRSWFMVVPYEKDGYKETRLYFGSAIIAQSNPKTGQSKIGLGYRVLLGFHRWYSRILLWSALRRI